MAAAGKAAAKRLKSMGLKAIRSKSGGSSAKTLRAARSIGVAVFTQRGGSFNMG